MSTSLFEIAEAQEPSVREKNRGGVIAAGGSDSGTGVPIAQGRNWARAANDRVEDRP